MRKDGVWTRDDQDSSFCDYHNGKTRLSVIRFGKEFIWSVSEEGQRWWGRAPSLLAGKMVAERALVAMRYAVENGQKTSGEMRCLSLEKYKADLALKEDHT